MTVSPPGHPATDDPQASLRIELLGKLVAAQMVLEKAIGELARSGVSTSAADAQVAHLAGLQASVGTASPATLAAMSGEVATAIAQSKVTADQAREQVNTVATGSALALADAARASHTAVADAMEAARHFQLTFASPAAEAEYRQREDERTRYIATQNAKHTPEGDLNAAGAAVGQMADAKANGAHGPEFDKQWSELAATTERLRESAKANGLSAEEFDRRLSDDIRRILKSKGLTDTEIDAQFAAHRGDPLETAKAYVNDGADLAKLQRSAERVDAMGKLAGPDEMASIADTLKSAGVAAQSHDPANAPDHGVAAAAAAINTRGV